MIDIRINPSDVWDYFESIGSANGVNIPIAIDADVGVYITGMVEEDYPVIVVTDNGEMIYEQVVVDAIDCADTVNDAIEDYLYGIDGDMSIEEREDELLCATEDFIRTAVLNTETLDTSVIKNCMEVFLMYLYKKHKLQIYRPMKIEIDGKEVMENYPFPHLYNTDR